ncbi:hypothetical protein G6F63_016603 [Rhizopus arrhizus]|nr:hypothetical protein G6F63_016603 [Rhizopus arrhizus]
MLARVWEPGLVGAMLGAAGAEASPDRDPGHPDPGNAPAPPDRAGAGPPDRRVQAAAGSDRRADPHPGRSRPPAAGDPRGTGQRQG